MARFVLFGSEEVFLVGGLALLAMVLLQLAIWTGSGLNRLFANRKLFQLNLKILERKLAAARVEQDLTEGEVGWNGFRTFRVSKLVRESDDISSIYLTPQDRRALPFYQPGQYLTFAFDFPEEKKRLVRCYSLSDAPNSEFYRCTVKRVAGAGDASDGKISTYINRNLQEGDLIQAKAPAGQFHLDLGSEQPVVLLAGGIGVTPLFSMLASIVRFQPHRRAIMYYGCRNGNSCALKPEIKGLLTRHRNIHVVTCYSDPLPTEKLGIDYDVKGWVTPELLNSTLPANNFEFYLCGPGPFMTSLYSGLREWGVPENSIHSEAFGPSSVGFNSPATATNENCERPLCKIRFAKSNLEIDFDSELESILDAAEELGVEIDSGCRAGNCGSCEIAILKGKAKYLKQAGVEPHEGHALSCVTTPDGDVEIDA